MSVAELPALRTLIVMDHTGDTKTIWDKNNPDEVSIARKTFKELKGKGYVGYKVKADGEKGQIMHEFDADAEKVIMSPAMAGG